MAALPPLADWPGLPLAEARRRLAAAGASEPRVVEAVAPRPRHEAPPRDAWRIARARQDGDVLEWVIVPPIALPE